MNTKIKSVGIDGKYTPWKIFQIPSLAKHYKSFSELRSEIGIESFSKGNFLNKPDEINFIKQNLENSYSILYPKYFSFLKFLKFSIIFQILIATVVVLINTINKNSLLDIVIIILFILSFIFFVILIYQKQKPNNLYKLSLNDEALFCFLYSNRAIYIDKVDNSYDRITYQDSDSKTQLFSTNNSSFELMPFLNKEKWGFKKDDKLVIDCHFDYIESERFTDMRFSEDGLALVSQGNHFGYIDKNGKTVIDFQYLIAKPFNDGLAVVANLEKKYGVIDIENNTIIDFKYDSIYKFNGNMFVVKLDEKFGLVNTLNDTVLHINYKEIEQLKSDMAVVTIKEEGKEKSGYINSKGEIIIEPIYSSAHDFVCNYAVVKEFDQYGLGDYGVINKSGDIIIPFEYEDLNIYELINFDSLKILITGCIEGKWGIVYLGSNISRIPDSTFTSDFNFSNEDVILDKFKGNLEINYYGNLRPFWQNDKLGFKDINDEIIIQPTFDDFYPTFINEIYIVTKNNKKGIINNKGDVLVDFVYDGIWQFPDGQIVVNRNERFFYLDEHGNELAKL